MRSRLSFIALVIWVALGFAHIAAAQSRPTIHNVTLDHGSDRLPVDLVDDILSRSPNTGTADRIHLTAPPAPSLATVPKALDDSIRLIVIEDPGPPYRTAIGYQALASNDDTSSLYNTATGYQALTANTAGSGNTANGYRALASNINGSYNTASGMFALYSNSEGVANTAAGTSALHSNTTGRFNTASGFQALGSNTVGFTNTASGLLALGLNSSGSTNTATGADALFSNTSGSANTASGSYALFSNTTGGFNTALGSYAGAAATVGNYNLFLGANVTGTADDTNTIRIGLPYDGASGQNQTFISGIYGTVVTNGLPVVIDANGQLGTINPQTGGGTPIAGGTFTTPNGFAELVRQLQDQQTTIADLRARLARVEALLATATK